MVISIAPWKSSPLLKKRYLSWRMLEKNLIPLYVMEKKFYHQKFGKKILTQTKFHPPS